MRNGMFFAASAYLLWGLFPLYFKMLQSIAPDQIMMHRMIWSLLLLVVILTVRRQWSWLRTVVSKPKVIAGFALSALLLSANWFLYIWAVNTNRLIDASLGYFISPLVNVLLGYVLLKERLRLLQWVAVALATIGVIWLAWQSGHPPWIGLAIASTFGVYGLLRKTASLGALEGLSLEAMLLFPFALAYLVVLSFQHHNDFAAATPPIRWLMVAAGPITVIPLLLFAAGARRIPMSSLGLMQYLAPTLQLLLGVLIYHEPFSSMRLIGFIAIWMALLLYSLDSLSQAWRTNGANSPRAA